MTSAKIAKTSEFAIRFKLRDVAHIRPWGAPDEPVLHWYALSNGIYCLDTSVGRLFRHGEKTASDLREPWCDYFVTSLFVDLCENWPCLKEPIPADVFDRYLAWHAREWDRFDQSDDDDLYALWFDATSWWHARELVFNYLKEPPRVHFWRMGAAAHLNWTAPPPWLPPQAKLSIPFEIVQTGIATFFQAFLSAMAERVNVIEATNWQPPDAALDIGQLLREQERREQQARSALSEVRETDWDFIRSKLDQLGA